MQLSHGKLGNNANILNYVQHSQAELRVSVWMKKADELTKAHTDRILLRQFLTQTTKTLKLTKSITHF